MSGLNWDREFALVQAADDAELLEELLLIFKDSYKNDLGRIKEALEDENVEEVKGAAHSIKGAAASLGILGIRDIAFNIEADAREGSLNAAQKSLSLLEALSEELMRL